LLYRLHKSGCGFFSDTPGLGDPGTNVVFPIAGSSVDSTTTFLSDDEVLYLGNPSIFPNTGDAGPTVNGLFFIQFRHLNIAEIPLGHQTAMQIKLENGIKSKDQQLVSGYELSHIITPLRKKRILLLNEAVS
jgi:hypothetical protein